MKFLLILILLPIYFLIAQAAEEKRKEQMKAEWKKNEEKRQAEQKKREEERALRMQEQLKRNREAKALREQSSIDDMEVYRETRQKVARLILYNLISAGVLVKKAARNSDGSLKGYYICEGKRRYTYQPKSPSGEPLLATGINAVDKMDGHKFEEYCADLLRQTGYTNVEVTKGSGDQGVDVIATKDGIKYAVQCKCYSSDLGNTPVQEVNAGKALYKCHVGVVLTNRYFTAGAKELAEATGVLLWDRDELMRMIAKAEK